MIFKLFLEGKLFPLKIDISLNTVLGGRQTYKTDQSRAVLGKAAVRSLSTLLSQPPSLPSVDPIEKVEE